jgi:FkbM family methyltransferase
MKFIKSIFSRMMNDAGYLYYKKDFCPFGIDHCNDIARFLGHSDLKTIIDVGANIGKTALEYSEKFPAATIYAMEPIKSTYDILCANTSIKQNIRTFHFAAGSNEGTMRVQLTSQSERNSLLGNSENLSSGKYNEEVVQIKRLDDLAAGEGFSRFDLLKTDTEGFDLEVIKGAEKLLRSSSNAFILSEVTFHRKDPCHTQFTEMHQHLAEYGFDFCGIYDQDYNSFSPAKPPLLYCNVLFYKK